MSSSRPRRSSSSSGPAERGRGARTGVFVTFEGVEGAGKSTQIDRLAATLERAGVTVVKTREPGGTPLGERLRAVLLEHGGASIEPAAELLLYAADRAQHLLEVIRPAVAEGATVLCDRYLDATLAYQGYGRELGADIVLRLHDRPPLDIRPDRTILLDLDAGEGLVRARARNRDRGLSRSEGKYEQEKLAFHERVRRGYLELAAAEPDRFRVVPAAGDPDAVETLVRDALADLLPVLARKDGR